MKRYTITEGAMTTAGGVVVQASSHGSINGARIALENDPIFCEGCRSTGRIRCVGPRLSELWNGKQVALENDLCICHCTQPPRLIASQSIRYQVIGDQAAAAYVRECVEGANATDLPGSTLSEDSYDQRFQVTDEVSGLPVTNWPYRIELANGASLEGRTDQEGMTAKIASTQAEQATLHLYELDAMPINPYWDQ